MIDVEKEIENIKEQISQLILIVSKNKQYTDYDIEAGRVNTSRTQESCDKNAEDITTNSSNIEVHDGALEMLTEDVLPTMQDDTTALSDIVDNILADVIPTLVEELSGATDESAADSTEE